MGDSLVPAFLAFAIFWTMVVVAAKPITERHEHIGFAAVCLSTWVFFAVASDFAVMPYLFWTVVPALAAFLAVGKNRKPLPGRATIFVGLIAVVVFAAAVEQGYTPRVVGQILVALLCLVFGHMGAHVARKYAARNKQSSSG